jgi:hypothetical protein
MFLGVIFTVRCVFMFRSSPFDDWMGIAP